jgi:class 3 adenylate cyclase/predicted ATPase
MFCDLVGSTEIASKLDAEEWRDLVGAYLDAASAAVTEMGGHVAKKLGDGLMALFGYPVAQENDTERAARAALSIQRALAELNLKIAADRKPRLVARIGLEAGQVVVDATGEIFGDAPNVAARVQALAEPGSVLVTSRVHGQVAGLFVAEDKGSHELKGVREPQTLFRLVRASGGGRRAGQRQLTPLVGRDDEIAVLMRCCERARQGDGRFVMIVGEPGLGKSRLIEELHRRLGEAPHTWLEWSCSQLLQNTPLHPIAEWGRQRFGGAETPADRRLADLENALAQVKLDPAENAPLLAPLLDIELPKDRAPTLAPEELRRRQLAALVGWMLASAKVQPIVLAAEDLQWADPTTIDLLRSVAERGSQAPLFVVVTMRPEFRPPWDMRSHHTLVSLAPLDPSQVRAMVTELSARHAFTGDVGEEVTARTGGVPLFVEEITRLLLDRGAQGGAHAIPPTLQQSLAARLDRLGPAREVAQIGSVIGRDFSYGLLSAATGMDDASLQKSLDRLADADVLLVQGLPPQSGYRFKHALIQDTAYEGLLKSRRQALHRRVAETLRDRFAATAEPEALAHHFTQAGLTDQAIEWWGKAGEQALRRSAFQEAIAHLGKAIEMADKASKAETGPKTSRERVKLQADYGRALMMSKGYTADETKSAFARVRELADKSSSSTELHTSYFGQWVVNLLRGNFAASRKIAEEFRDDAQAKALAVETAAACRALGWSCFALGDLASSQESFLRAIRALESQPENASSFQFGLDTYCLANNYFACTKWLMGEFAAARELTKTAIARAEAIDHAPTTANLYLFIASLEAVRGSAEASLHAANIVVECSNAHNLAQYLAYGETCQGWARARLGDRDGGTEQLRRSLAKMSEQGSRYWLPFYQSLHAELDIEASRFDSATAMIEGALALAQETGEHWSDAHLHKLHGEALLKRNPKNAEAAEAAFLTAIAVARQQNARSFELRAALSLAKLSRTDRPADAHAVLAPALEGFSPTPEMPEIEEAEKLRDTLAESDEVKNAELLRRRRLQLQNNYARAMLWSKGYAAAETKSAFDRVRELAPSDADSLPALYAQYQRNFMRGDYASAEKTAAALLSQAQSAGSASLTAVGRRLLGQTFIVQGRFKEAQIILDQVLDGYVPELDAETRARFGVDVEPHAKMQLALAVWHLGEFSRARLLEEQSIRQVDQNDHVPSRAIVYVWWWFLLQHRGDGAQASLRAAETLVTVGMNHNMAYFASVGEIYLAWARGRLSDPGAGARKLREALKRHQDEGNRASATVFQCLLAELEAASGELDLALGSIDEGLQISREVGERLHESHLYCLRGKFLLKRDPADTASAEEAFLTAIAVAQEQESRSLGLRAAVSLAELYLSTSRPAEAHAVLAPALKGFWPTPEMPEIEEAQKLLGAFAKSDEV